MNAAAQMVAREAERRVGERRASLHVATAADRRGNSSETWTTHQRSRVEILLVEAQAAAEHALAAAERAIAAAKKLTDALREARAASVAARRAAHLAAGAVSGAEA